MSRVHARIALLSPSVVHYLERTSQQSEVLWRDDRYTYNNLEHACAVETVQAYFGVVNWRGRTKVRFVVFAALIKCFDTKIRLFFTSCEIFIRALAKIPTL